MTLLSAPNRRILLNALLALPVLGGTAQASSALNAGAGQRAAASGRLTGVFSNRQSAAILGQAYLMRHPEEADADHLEQKLLSPANLQVLFPPGTTANGAGLTDVSRLKRGFQELRRQDFDQGNVLQIDGCMLSVTELRLCALAALT
ncbi:hypothetical protein [Pelagibius sp. Alg239-R121]|uniref:hypothetical protein n=1 Tax=Pelagibius sp. Alg239-R121 TaxID=2993448 RepID=UPI0024A62763|nr:hypothetical protein [Pelagibius sp. Alg239-R121]